MLFDEYPVLEDDAICLRRMVPDNADDLLALTQSEAVYKYVPNTLYELRYDNKQTVIERMDDECFKTHYCLLLGTFVGSEHNEFAGISEVYDYDPKKQEVYIGGRYSERYWGRSIAAHVISLLRDYLFACEGIQTIHTHVMEQNNRSNALMRKCGFESDGEPFLEDWGKGPVLVYSYTCSRPS